MRIFRKTSGLTALLLGISLLLTGCIKINIVKPSESSEPSPTVPSGSESKDPSGTQGTKPPMDADYDVICNTEQLILHMEDVQKEVSEWYSKDGRISIKWYHLSKVFTNNAGVTVSTVTRDLPIIHVYDDATIAEGLETNMLYNFSKDLEDFTPSETGQPLFGEFYCGTLKDGWSNTEPLEVYTTENILSFGMYRSTYTGGAHGSDDVQGYTLNLKTGNPVSYNEILVDDGAYTMMRLLAHNYVQSWEYYEAGQDYETCAENGLPADKFDDIRCNFIFTESGLRLIYGPYGMGFYAAGNADFTIPYSELKGIVKPEFLK